MNNEVESYVGELRDLRRVNHAILKNRETIEKWITWLDAEIRQKVSSDWEIQNKRELKSVLQEIILTHEMVHTEQKSMRVSGVPYEVDL